MCVCAYSLPFRKPIGNPLQNLLAAISTMELIRNYRYSGDIKGFTLRSTFTMRLPWKIAMFTGKTKTNFRTGHGFNGKL